MAWYDFLTDVGDTAASVADYFLPEKVNLADSSQYFDDWGAASDLPAYAGLAYAPTRDAVVRTVAPEDRGFWSMVGDATSGANNWLKENEPLMKWGIPAVGGIASYMSAQDYNKRADQARAQLAAEAAKREALAKQLGASRNFTLSRTRKAAPSAARGSEAAFFDRNALSANPSTVQGYAGGGAVQQQFAPEYYSGGQLNFAKGGNVKKKASPLASVTVRKELVVPSQAELEEKLMQQRAIEQMMLEQADRYGSGIDEQPTAGMERLMQSAPKLGGYACGGYMCGGTAGQSDQVPAMLSDGEFVMDAETVSMLGDGNNAAGASALEAMRQNIRKQKRSAPANKIPPKAKKPEQYMKKGSK